MPQNTVDQRSSPPADWKPHGLITKGVLWVTYNAAKHRMGQNGKDKDPLEWEATNLWEDLYHHDLLRGYCNNSQIPPHDTSGNRCDIVTRYFNHHNHRQTLLFTEVKRANKAEVAVGIKDAEQQVLGYCTEYLRASTTPQGNHKIFACTAIGPYIRCFEAKPLEGPGIQPIMLYDLCNVMEDLACDGTTKPWTMQASEITDYMDAGDDQQSKKIRDCFAMIKRGTKPPFPVGSRPDSSSSSDAPPDPEGSPMSGIIDHADSGSQYSLPSQMSGIGGDTADGESSSLGPKSIPDRTRAQSTGWGAGPQTPPQHREIEAPTPETPSRVTKAGTRESTGSPSNRVYHRTAPSP
ncbi:hypothetical protein VPNG_02828 [Cytospora leucostoma]|uniref:Uncharacterized protein n=1 Tax=Cytospora leucostoma TaxID=1230097 RepID=A0A423XJT2_9PEZI|nr:hypothetical protein VPNG_02828 [Cytospora leucostoma]